MSHGAQWQLEHEGEPMSDSALVCMVALICVVAMVAIVFGRNFTGRVGPEGAEATVTGNKSQPDPAANANRPRRRNLPGRSEETARQEKAADRGRRESPAPRIRPRVGPRPQEGRRSPRSGATNQRPVERGVWADAGGSRFDVEDGAAANAAGGAGMMPRQSSMFRGQAKI